MINKEEKRQQSFISSVVEFIFLLSIVFLVRTFVFGLYQVPTGSMEVTMLVGDRYFADKFSYNFRKPRHNEIIAFNDPEYSYSKNSLVNIFQRYVWGPSNWTKRVIGVPGDTIMGVIENGKPVVYCNGQRLEEPYVNKYPMIRSWRRDTDAIYKSIEADLQKMARGRHIDPKVVERYIAQREWQESTMRSYNPSQAWDKQDFYRLTESRICRNVNGDADIRYPGTPLFSTNTATMPDQTHNNWNGSDVFFVKLGDDEYWCMGDNRLGSHDCRFFGPIKGYQIHGRIIFRIWSLDSDESWFIVDLIKHPFDFWTRVRWSRFFTIMS